MKNIEKTIPYQSNIKQTKQGTITTLQCATGISAKDNICCEGKSLLANYVYKEYSTYHLVYSVIGTEGNSEHFAEDQGILPTLFLSPSQEIYVSVVPYSPEKESEISIPLFNRETTVLPKANKPFTGKFIGTCHQFSIFFETDTWSGTKPDKLLAIEFKDGLIKKKYNIKIAPPIKNKIFIINNEIHLLAKEGKGWLHRQIDEMGNSLQQRMIETKQNFFREIVNLSFTQTSYLLTEEEGNIIVEIIDKNGISQSVNLIGIKDPFFNTWQPVQVGADRYVTRFNTEFGNGWFTTQNEVLLEFFYSREKNAYRNVLTNELIEMDNPDLIISGINKTSNNNYAIIFYPRTERNGKAKEIIIFNRGIK